MNKINLFVYGTLTNEAYVKIITGKTFQRKKAVLPSFRKITPAGGFPYIKPFSNVFVNGYILLDVDEAALKKLDEYEDEGFLYRRTPVKFWMDGKMISGQTYVGNVENLKQYYHSRIDAKKRVEKHLEAKAEKVLQDEIKARGLLDIIGLNTRVLKELKGQAVESVILAALDGVRQPDSLLMDNLKKENAPTLKDIMKNKQACKYADAYISFAVRHMIFNQIEEKIRDDFRDDILVSKRFYVHTISNLVALQFMNQHYKEIVDLMNVCGINRMDGAKDYEEYAKLAIIISDSLYRKELFNPLVKHVRESRVPGFLPLGAEIEMSNLGAKAPEAGPEEDPVFDNFYYFHDFDLAKRTWKLGGYVDDHGVQTNQQKRSRGFLEYAFGRFRTIGDFSKPITQCPWILSELINAGLTFALVQPHSLHIAIQLPREKICYEVPSNVTHLICLLLIGGDLGFDNTGQLREKRIYDREILDSYNQLNFSRENIHFPGEIEGKIQANTVIEFQFPRLVAFRNYQPLILALKGYLLGANPRPLIPHPERVSSINTEEFEEKQALIDWAENPQPLSNSEIRTFLNEVEKGLMKENNGKPAHDVSYIRANLTAIKTILHEKNRLIREYRD